MHIIRIFFIKVFLINTSSIDQLTDRGKIRVVRKAQKLEHLKNEKSFFGKIRNISHNFRDFLNFLKKLNSEETQKNFEKADSKDLIEAYETETLTCINMH